MFEIANKWKLIINESKQAILDKDNEIFASISAIEPSINFTFNTIGVYLTSSSALPHWYAGGEVFQLFKTSFGTAGYAQSESVKIILNRYHVHRFTIFSSESRYLLSFVPKPWLKDVNLKVWEYVGNEAATLNSLELNIKIIEQRIISESAAIKALIKKNQH